MTLAQPPTSPARSRTPRTPAELTLRKVVDNTAGGYRDGGQLHADGDSATQVIPGRSTVKPISGVTGVPAVTDRPVKRGVFNLSETQIAGYAASWVCVDATGTTISSSNQVNIPVDITSLGQLDITCTVTNTFAALDIGISGPPSIRSGVQHTFTLTATSTTNGTTFTPLAGAILDLDLTTESGLDIGDITYRRQHVRDRARHERERPVHLHGASNASGVVNLIANGFAGKGRTARTPVCLRAAVAGVVEQDVARVPRRRASVRHQPRRQPHTFTLSGTQIVNARRRHPNEGPLQEGALIDVHVERAGGADRTDGRRPLRAAGSSARSASTARARSR